MLTIGEMCCRCWLLMRPKMFEDAPGQNKISIRKRSGLSCGTYFFFDFTRKFKKFIREHWTHLHIFPQSEADMSQVVQFYRFYQLIKLGCSRCMQENISKWLQMTLTGEIKPQAGFGIGIGIFWKKKHMNFGSDELQNSTPFKSWLSLLVKGAAIKEPIMSLSIASRPYSAGTTKRAKISACSKSKYKSCWRASWLWITS